MSIILFSGVQLLLYPGAFNMTTGPAHWELLAQARALDNQMYVGTISPARDEGGSYVAWGHSSVVNPWGKVVAKAGPEEEIVHTEIGEMFDILRQPVCLRIQINMILNLVKCNNIVTCNIAQKQVYQRL